MKLRLSSRFWLFSLVVAQVIAALSLRAEPPHREDLAGSTWELVSYKYGDADEWQNASGSERKLKMLTDTHVVWVAYQTGNGSTNDTGGGTWTLSGATYTEIVEFGGASELRGKKQVFTLDLRGDRLEQTGQLSTGFKIAEVWQRVR